jgi:hypothetical protein
LFPFPPTIDLECELIFIYLLFPGGNISSTATSSSFPIEEEVHLSANEVNRLVYCSDSDDDEEVFDEALNECD